MRRALKTPEPERGPLPAATRSAAPAPGVAPERAARPAPPASPSRVAGDDELAPILARAVRARSLLARSVAPQDQMLVALAKTLANGDAGDVVDLVERHPTVLGSQVSEAAKLALLRKLDTTMWFRSPHQQAAAQLWNSFGEEHIAQVAKANQGLWDKAVKRGMPAHEIPVLQAMQERFEGDVTSVALSHMDFNLAATDQELRSLGLGGGATPVHPLQRDARRQEVRELMSQVALAQVALQELQKIAVGHHSEKQAEGPVIHTLALFEPGRRPDIDPTRAELASDFHPHAEVQQWWDTVQGFISLSASQSPAVYAAMAQGQVGTIADMTSSADRLAETGKVLKELRSNIAVTRRRIDSGEIDPRSLAPIHAQLFAGQQRGSSTIDWSSPVAKAVGSSIVDAHESARMWLQLKLGLLAGGAFIAMELFSVGAATIPGAILLGSALGIGTGVAAESWVQSRRLGAAAGSSADAEHQVVTAEQARAAQWEAVLNTVFVALDAIAPAWKAGKVAMHGMRAEAVVAEQTLSAEWKRIAKLAADPSTAGEGAKAFERLVAAHGEVQTIERLVTELGAERAMQVTGKSAEELASRLPAKSAVREQLEQAAKLGLGAKPLSAAEAASVEAAQRARRGKLAAGATDSAAARAWLEGGDLESRIGGLVAAVNHGVIDPKIGSELALEAIQRWGPQRTVDLAGGWSKLSTALTDASSAAGPFMRWRDGVFEDLRAFAKKELKLDIPKQGTNTKFKNDLDISALDGASHEHRERLAQYLAKRLEVRQDPATLDHLLKIELFSDPRRLHAYDALPAPLREKVAGRQAAFERELIPNRDLYQARKHANHKLVAEIREQMRKQGVKEYDYVPLSAGQIRRLGQRLDDAHKALLSAVQRGDMAEAEKAADELGRSQALINAAHDGGYFSGGGGRAYVSDRAGETPMALITPTALRGQVPVERYTVLLDQLSKLNHAAEGLASTKIDNLVDAVRAVGKYGERAQEIIHMPGMAVPIEGLSPKWESLLAKCMALKHAADSGHSAARLRLDPAKVVKEVLEALDDARASSLHALEQIGAQTGLSRAEGAAAKMTAQIRNHVRALQVIDGLKASVGEPARGGSAAVGEAVGGGPQR
jgi:hypothetical protein